MKRSIAGLFLLCLALGCREEYNPGFAELDPMQTGVRFTNQLVESPELNILTYLYYYNGGGVLAADFNNDTLPDLYFSANQQIDRLYLNQGNMSFREVTQEAGLENADGWTTGISHVDINGDGLEDLYICKASGYRALEGRNKLFINQGINADGVPTFEEAAKTYGLDFSGLSTQAAFFDYDLDGDLDLFLLNHSVHPNRNYGKGSQRRSVDPISGDRLYRNDDGYFKDVSAEAGIFQGKAGYGLGIGISDLNDDGYPDVYVGNDFFENDYLYLNRGDGTFEEVVGAADERIGHTTHFSMGNDLADINNDGMVDILSLDMLPEDLLTYKTSGLEYAYPIYRQYLKNGFAPQYMQNTLQVNLGDGRFSETAFLSGVAATEWSWGSLLADLDNDGHKDLFVTNGIKGATNDMDYMNFIANEDIQRRIDNGMQQADMPLTREIPAKKVPNYIYRNNGDLTFTDMTTAWLGEEPTFSNGSTYADLDRDGDLDLVINHVDQQASILENNLDTGKSLTIRFEGTAPNTRGIGARILAYADGNVQVVEHFTTRGYLSAVPSEIHLGLGTSANPDSLLVIWPGGAWQTLYPEVKSRNMTLRQEEAQGNYYRDRGDVSTSPWQTSDSLLPFIHRENLSLDFDREPLVPYARSNEGPDLSIGDVNRDGLDDIFISGAKRQASALYIQQADGSLSATDSALFAEDALNEDTGHLFLDVDRDKQLDLLVVSGGNEFKSGKPLQPRLYRNINGRFQKDSTAFAGFDINASAVDSVDIDLDGDLDIFISADGIAGAFGKSPQHGLFENDGSGRFSEVTRERIPEIQEFGSITDFNWTDLNADGIPDLIAAGHWAPVAVFLSEGNRWVRAMNNGLDQTHGLWNCIEAFDIDGDGDTDLVGGNWGLNSKLKASPEFPLTLYREDFDQNGSVEPLVTYFHQGVETPFASKDELGKQMPFLNKKFRTYREFALASLEELFGAEALNNADRKQVVELASCVFLNQGGGSFEKMPLHTMAQTSVVYDIMPEDVDGDGYRDLILTGNLFEVSTQLGRMDAFHGLVLLNAGSGSFTWSTKKSPTLSGAGRKLDTLRLQKKKYYIMGRNNASPLFISRDGK